MVTCPSSPACCAAANRRTVLPLASTPGGHRLGVNGLAYDQDRSILYVTKYECSTHRLNREQVHRGSRWRRMWLGLEH
jgi:hypothetical protein